MSDVEKNGPGITNPKDFAQNRLALIVPSDNPAGIKSVNDLANPGVKVVLAAPGVPAGDYARQMLENAGIQSAALKNVVSNEQDDATVLEKVASGEADAGIVYDSDLSSTSASRVQSIAIPDRINVLATYSIGAVTGAHAQDAGALFADFVLGPSGQKILAGFGFLPPPGGVTD
jgi:molybdate transport system substrate-binding protein